MGEKNPTKENRPAAKQEGQEQSYTIRFLQDRYLSNQKEMIAYVKMHLEELNADGENVKCIKGNWFLNSKGLEILDDLRDYKKEQEIMDEVKLNTNDLSSERKEELLRKKVEELEEALELERSQKIEYSDGLNALQKNFLSLESKKETIKNSLIIKHQQEAEKAARDLAKLKARFSQESDLKNRRIQDLENRNKEMSDKLISDHNEIEKKTQECIALEKQIADAEYKVLESKKNQDRIYADLHRRESNIVILQQKLKNAIDDRDEAIHKLSFVQNQIRQAKLVLGMVNEHLETILPEENIADNQNNQRPKPKSVLMEDDKKLPAGKNANGKKDSTEKSSVEKITAKNLEQSPHIIKVAGQNVMMSHDNHIAANAKIIAPEIAQQILEPTEEEKKKGFFQRLASFF